MNYLAGVLDTENLLQQLLKSSATDGANSIVNMVRAFESINTAVLTRSNCRTLARTLHSVGCSSIRKFDFILSAPVDARSQAWAFGRALAGIVGANPTGDMDVFSCECLWVVR
jgi:hypothetical protein